MTLKEYRVDQKSLHKFTQEIFTRVGLPPSDAETVATVLLWANLRGVDSHGVILIPWYLELIDTKQMNTKPVIRIEKETPAAILIEADRALGAVGTVFAMKQAIAKAKKAGVGWIIIRNITHQGAIGYYPLIAAESDMAGIAFVCNPPNMAPYGARVAGVHNSPIAVSVPVLRHRPLVLDMATSVVAAGKIKVAIDKGRSIPQGWALDKNGRDTTNPLEAVTLLPMAGPKGSGLSIMFECLSSIMANNPMLEPDLIALVKGKSEESEKQTRELRPGYSRWHVQNGVVAAIDISQFTNVTSYKEHIGDLIDGIKALPKAEGFSEIFVPGEPEWRTFEQRSRDGIPLPEGTVKSLRGIANRYHIELPVGLA